MSMAEWVMENVKSDSFWIWRRGDHKLGLRVTAFAAGFPYDEDDPYRIEAVQLYYYVQDAFVPDELTDGRFIRSRDFYQAVQDGELKQVSFEEIEELGKPKNR